MSASFGPGPQTLIPLEQLRKNALTQAARRGKVIATSRTMRRVVWDLLWEKVFPSIGLFFCIAVLLFSISAYVGGWSLGLTQASQEPASKPLTPTEQSEIDFSKPPNSTRPYPTR